jgi:hypothetical protein
LPPVVATDLSLKRVANTVYRLNGPVYVGVDCGYDPVAPYPTCAPATLTIEPGVTVVGSQSLGALVVRRGSHINAVGTATAPIVFTSEKQLAGSVDDSSTGLWYGVAVLGRAFIADCLETPYNPRCDLPLNSFSGSFFGGGTDDEGSGTFRFVQIRFSTAGLVAAGVGGRTQIDHVHVHNANGFSLTANGGRPNFQYVALTGGGGINADHGHRGTFQYIVAVTGKTGGEDRALQVDRFLGVGNNAFLVPRTYTRISNATILQTRSATGNLAFTVGVEGGADFAMLNSVTVSPNGCLEFRDSETLSGGVGANSKFKIGAPLFRSVVMQCATPFFQGAQSVPASQVGAAFGSGANNNNAFYTSTLTNLFVNGANETAVAVTDPTPFNTDSFADPITNQPNPLTATTFAGAIRNSSDTSFQEWTCNAGYFSFGGGGGSCNALPPS